MKGVRFALISDIHSNLEALEAVFARIDELGVEEVACLGDVIGYGADPRRCTELVMERCKWTLMGNHDWGLFHAVGDFNPLAAEALLYTRKKLKPSLLHPGRRSVWQYLENLLRSHTDWGYDFFHGSPRDPIMEYVLKSDAFLEPDKMKEIFERVKRPCFVGHTHWPGVHRADHKFTQATDEQSTFPLPHAPAIVNVGSVGQPRDGDPRACFVVIEGQAVHFQRVAYDFRKTQARILGAGLHPALADRLARGK